MLLPKTITEELVRRVRRASSLGIAVEEYLFDLLFKDLDPAKKKLRLKTHRDLWSYKNEAVGELGNRVRITFYASRSHAH